MITKAMKVGQRSRKLKTVELWRIHIAEEAAIDSWWLQLQGNSEGSQRGLKQWLLDMLKCWWKQLSERHAEADEVV